MSKNGNSANFHVFAGARIAGPPTYTPSHIKPGMEKPIGAKAEFNVYLNAGNKEHVFRITAWGKMADVIARSGATGKELTIFSEASSYPARVWMQMPDGSRQFVTKPDGTPLLTTKVGFTLQNIVFGADSAKTITEEIVAGMRPPGWNVGGHADQLNWKNICATKNNEQYIQGAGKFGYAKVFLPEGAQIVANVVANNAATNVNTVVQGMAPVVGTAQYAGNPAAVHTAIPGQVVAPMQPVPVIVNGQNMGYAPPINPVTPITNIIQPGGYAAPVM